MIPAIEWLSVNERMYACQTVGSCQQHRQRYVVASILIHEAAIPALEAGECSSGVSMGMQQWTGDKSRAA